MRKAIAAAALVLMSVGLVPHARAQQDLTEEVQDPAEINKVPDYLGRTGECAKSVEARQGAWFCSVATPTKDASGLVPDSQGAVATTLPAETEVTAEDKGTCQTGGGCWNYDKKDGKWVTFDGVGWYGFGGNVLGTVAMYFEVTAKGRVLTVSPIRFRSSRTLQKAAVRVEVLYVDGPYPEGHPQKPEQVKIYSRNTPLPADTQLVWPSRPSWTDTIWVPTVIVEMSWWDLEYPGRWYMWAKSIQFLKNEELGGAYFADKDLKPLDPLGAGWKEE